MIAGKEGDFKHTNDVANTIELFNEGGFIGIQIHGENNYATMSMKKEYVEELYDFLGKYLGKVPFRGLRIVGKDTAVDTGIYLDGVPLDAICDISILFRPNERNRVVFHMLDFDFYWKDGRWARKLKKTKFMGEIEKINQEIILTSYDLNVMKKLNKKNKNFEKSFG